MGIRTSIIAGSAAVLVGSWIAIAHGQAAAPQVPWPAPPAPTDKAAYFSGQEIQSVWKDLEQRQVINKRVIEGGSYSINIRIVKAGDAPLVHGKSADVWIVTGGSATAVTGGKLLDAKQRGQSDDFAGSSIANGVEQPLKPGDVVFVPPGVPHGFKDVKNFRAFLIRFDTK
jgi:mannose-6-phosphate isomerase-like protein (cupin superfamily)